MTDDPIYLDHAATTPVRPEVRAAMEPFLSERFGNAASIHAAGREARAALEGARERVAGLLGAEPREIVFTAGGTEADNLGVLGRWRADGRGVAVSAIEHSAVRAAAAQAAREGAALSVVAVDEAGRLALDALEEALAEPHAVVSVMWANNEVGTVQDMEAIAELCHAHDAVLHTDAVQAVAHVPTSVGPVDLLSLSGHKFGAPKGIGALYVRDGVAVEPLLLGGGQERGLRGGTSNVAGAVGLAEALRLVFDALPSESERLADLRDRLEGRILEAVPDAVVNGGAERLPHILSVSLEGIPSDALLPALDLAGLAVSAGSACHSGAAVPSHVLLAMGAPREAVRLSLGWTTTADDVERAGDRFIEVVRGLRAVA